MLYRLYIMKSIRESMTLFEVDRVFWTRQDFCLGEPFSPLHAKIATDKTCLQVRGHVVLLWLQLILIVRNNNIYIVTS